MLETFTLETFAPLTGAIFRLQLPDAELVDMTLETVNDVPVNGWAPDEATSHRKPFSLVFRGPPGLLLPQAIYPFQHDALGRFEIFIVPIGQTAQGVSYEVVFS